jgi:RNA recognition motif-containing protein
VSTKLYVSNLPSSATEEVLAGKFSQFGTVVSVKLDRDTGTGIGRRSAFVEMRTAADAQKAIHGLNFADFDGRLMSVYRAVTAGIAH